MHVYNKRHQYFSGFYQHKCSRLFVSKNVTQKGIGLYGLLTEVIFFRPGIPDAARLPSQHFQLLTGQYIQPTLHDNILKAIPVDSYKILWGQGWGCGEYCPIGLETSTVVGNEYSENVSINSFSSLFRNVVNHSFTEFKVSISVTAKDYPLKTVSVLQVKK